MRTRSRRAAGVLLTLVVGLGMTACVGGEPLPTLPPTPDSTPIFGSEEEALAAAEAAYAAYNEMSNAIAKDGGSGAERIAPFVTDEYLQVELDTAALYRENRYRLEGDVSITDFSLQRYDESVGVAEVVAYVCLDVSATRVVDESGADVTPDRQAKVGLEVTFVGDSTDGLKVGSSEQWSDSSYCS